MRDEDFDADPITAAPPPLRRRRTLWIVIQLAAVLLAVIGTYLGFRRGAVIVTAPTLEPLPTFAMSSQLETQIALAAVGQASTYTCPRSLEIGPLEVAACLDCMFFPVDKLRTLRSDYEPPLVRTGLAGGGMVRPEVQPSLKALFEAAVTAGYSPIVTSAYRSYQEQVSTFNSWVSFEMRGAAVSTLTPVEAALRAERYSARPGRSEHQLGTVVDVNCAGCAPFDENDVRNRNLWRFLEQNAHLYGFVISYPRGIEALTGYKYEAWHLRYIGADYAQQMVDAGYLSGNGVCLLNFLRSIEAMQQ